MLSGRVKTTAGLEFIMNIQDTANSTYPTHIVNWLDGKVIGPPLAQSRAAANLLRKTGVVGVFYPPYMGV